MAVAERSPAAVARRACLGALLSCLLLLPARAAAADDWVIRSVRVAAASGQALDLGTTLDAVGRGGFERNPAIRWATDNPWKLTAVKAGQAVLQDWAIRSVNDAGHRKWAIVLGVGFAAASTAVAIHNWRAVR
jgi:hypothetical protein